MTKHKRAGFNAQTYRLASWTSISKMILWNIIIIPYSKLHFQVLSYYIIVLDCIHITLRASWLSEVKRDINILNSQGLLIMESSLYIILDFFGMIKVHNIDSILRILHKGLKFLVTWTVMEILTWGKQLYPKVTIILTCCWKTFLQVPPLLSENGTQAKLTNI